MAKPGTVAFVLWIVLLYLFLRVLFPQIFASVPLPLLYMIDSFAVAMLFATGSLPLWYLFFTFYHLAYIPLYALKELVKLILKPLCIHTDLGFSDICDFVDWNKVLKKSAEKAMKKELKKKKNSR